MKHLTRPAETIEHPADVAAIRAAMRELGFDADDLSVQWAWRAVCREWWCEGWHPPGGEHFEQDVQAVIERLVPADEPGEG